MEILHAIIYDWWRTDSLVQWDWIFCSLQHKGPFTYYYVMVFSSIFDSPSPMLYFVMFSIMKLWFFLLISLYQNIYLISTHTILQSIFGVYPTVFPNNVVLWCIMIITLFLVPLPPPPVIKCYVLAYPLPPSGACNMGMTPKRESQLDNTFFIKSQHS